MELENVQAAEPTLENNVQATEPTYAIQETNAGRRLVRVEAKPQEAAEPVTEPAKAEEPVVTEPVNAEPVAEETTKVEEQTDIPKPYTIEEMQDAEDITKLDTSRIPDELKPFHKLMVRGMNQKFQEMAAERKALLAMTEAIKKPAVEQQPNPKELFLQRHNFIKSKVEEMFGEEYEPLLHPEHELAYQQVNAQLQQIEQQKQNAQKEQLTQQQKVDSVVMELKSQSDFMDVLNFAHNSMPAKDWEDADKLLKEGNKDAVMGKFKEWRNKYYGVNEKPVAAKPEKAKPPVLETATKAKDDTSSTVKLDADFNTRFRNASEQDKIKMISEWRKSRK